MDNNGLLYEEMEENVEVKYIGFTSGKERYDFAFVYTSMFFGQMMVICMQNGRSALLEPEDIENNPNKLCQLFTEKKEKWELSTLLFNQIQNVSSYPISKVNGNRLIF